MCFSLKRIHGILCEIYGLASIREIITHSCHPQLKDLSDCFLFCHYHFVLSRYHLQAKESTTYFQKSGRRLSNIRYSIIYWKEHLYSRFKTGPQLSRYFLSFFWKITRSQEHTGRNLVPVWSTNVEDRYLWKGLLDLNNYFQFLSFLSIFIAFNYYKFFNPLKILFSCTLARFSPADQKFLSHLAILLHSMCTHLTNFIVSCSGCESFLLPLWIAQKNQLTYFLHSFQQNCFNQKL